MSAPDSALLIHAAAEALRVLRFFGVTRPTEIVVEDIAAGLDVDVSVRDLACADALLVRVGPVGSIVVSGQLSTSDRRFAVAHELGHWRLHGTASQLFYCSGSNLRDYRLSTAELEANTFACELLAPRTMIDTDMVGSPASESALSALTSIFHIPLAAAAVRYIQLTPRRAVAVYSSSGRLSWWRGSSAACRMLPVLRVRRHLSAATVASRVRSSGSRVPTLGRVRWKYWFEGPPSLRQGHLFELAALDSSGDAVVSVIWVPGCEL